MGGAVLLTKLNDIGEIDSAKAITYLGLESINNCK